MVDSGKVHFQASPGGQARATAIEENPMPNSKRILVAVDGSATSRHTVAYVAAIAGGCPGLHVGLVHLELPPRMLEWGGTEDPEKEDRISSERAEAYQETENAAIEKGQAVLQR